MIQATAIIEMTDVTFTAGLRERRGSEQVNYGVQWVAKKLDVQPAWVWGGVVITVLILGILLLSTPSDGRRLDEHSRRWVASTSIWISTGRLPTRQL